MATDRRFGYSGEVAIKGPCVAATTANITLSGTQTIDAVAVVVDDRGCVVAEGPLALTQWLIRKRAAGLSPYRWGEATESPAAPFGPPEERN